ncbi:MAG: branched-chain amino acid ABC transporter permease [Thermoanaerobacteraceae bacterium]|nr:branched-chain amino acid ABC transporter permease [Thermoanaerobacteraceae bacterium]
MFLGVTLLIALIILPFGLGSYGLSLMISVLIFGLFAMSLDILIGYTGLVSFNHATFFGVGAYVVAILFYRGWDNFWLALPAAVAASVLLATVLGLVVLRSSGPYFLMITLAFGQMIFALAWKWRTFTGGDDGLPGIPRPDLGFPVSMWNEQNFYYLVLVFICLSFLLLRQLFRLPLGRAIIGVKESESRMQALGYNTWLLKYLAYVIAAGFAGLAGVLYVYYNGFISPQELNWTMSGMAILMVVIGGTGTLVGPVLGAGIILILQNLLSAYTERWPLVIGMLFVICVIHVKDGIAGYVMKLWEKGWKGYESPGSEKPN